MGNNNNLPKDIQDQIKAWSERLVWSNDESPYHKRKFEEYAMRGATEWALKYWQEKQLNDGYKEWAQDIKSLCREIGVILSGDGAAKQPSLCDLVGPIRDLKQENEKLKQALADLKEQNTDYSNRLIGLQVENEGLKELQDHLVEHNEKQMRIVRLALQSRSRLFKEYQALKEKAEKIRLALVMAVFAMKLSYNWDEFPADAQAERASAIRIGEEALSAWNSEQKEVE